MKRVLKGVLLAAIVLSSRGSVAMAPSDAVLWDSEGVSFLSSAPVRERDVAVATRPRVTFDIEESHAPASSSFWKDCRSVFCVGLTLTFLVILAVRLWIWATQPGKIYLVDNLENPPPADNETDFLNTTNVSTHPALEQSTLSPALQWCKERSWAELSKTLKRAWEKCPTITPPLSADEEREAKMAFVLGGPPHNETTSPWNQTVACLGLPQRIREWLYNSYRTNSSLTNEPCAYLSEESLR